MRGRVRGFRGTPLHRADAVASPPGHLGAAGREPGPRVVLTTVPEEQHVLGLLMSECLLTLEGAACIPLGTQTPLADIVRAASAHAADVVAPSFPRPSPHARCCHWSPSCAPARRRQWRCGWEAVEASASAARRMAYASFLACRHPQKHLPIGGNRRRGRIRAIALGQEDSMTAYPPPAFENRICAPGRLREVAASLPRPLVSPTVASTSQPRACHLPGTGPRTRCRNGRRTEQRHLREACLGKGR